MAPIVNCSTWPPARFVDWSVTSLSVGMSASRSRARATSACERAEPVTTKPVGAAVAEGVPVVEDGNFEAVLLVVVVEVDGVAVEVGGVVVGAVAAPTFA